MQEQYIPTTDASVPFTPKCLMTGSPAEEGGPKTPGPDDPIFYVKPVTDAEFDRLGHELFRHNIMPPSQDSYRAHLVEEIFEIYGDEKGEETAILLDEYWLAEEAFKQQMAEWQEQDYQRRLDIAQGAPTRPHPVMPTHPMPLRRRNKAMLVADEVKNVSEKIRMMTIEGNTYGERQRAGLIRLTMVDWKGLNTPYVFDNGIVPEETFAALQREIGKAAVGEIGEYILSFGAIQERERGNSGSPLETGSIEQPSQEPSGESDSNAGPSTSEAPSIDTDPMTSNSTQIPEPGSDPTIEESSTSTSPSDGGNVTVDLSRPVG